jgi:hypothetical protein
MKIDGSGNWPEWKCHKIVRAVKVESVMDHEPGCGAYIVVEGSHPGFDVEEEFIERHNPKRGDWIVLYADGYVSVSPGNAFEEGYELFGVTGGVGGFGPWPEEELTRLRGEVMEERRLKEMEASRARAAEAKLRELKVELEETAASISCAYAH